MQFPKYKLRDFMKAEEIQYGDCFRNPLFDDLPPKYHTSFLLHAQKETQTWQNVSSNPGAIRFLEKHQDKICWRTLSQNPAAMHLLEANPEKISWHNLSYNPAAIHLLEANLDKISWEGLRYNPAGVQLYLKTQNHRNMNESLSNNPGAIHLFENNWDKIYWEDFGFNEAAIEIIESFLEIRQRNEAATNEKFAQALKHFDLGNQSFWISLPLNSKAAHILEKYPDNIIVRIYAAIPARVVSLKQIWTNSEAIIT